jgi:acetolactate synthase I/II/III large subunit
VSRARAAADYDGALSNRKYAILLNELTNVGANPGRVALDMMDLGNPDIGWVAIAQGMGIEAARATTLAEFADLFAQANSADGPFLIELVI